VAKHFRHRMLPALETVRDLAVLFLHLLATGARLAGPGCAFRCGRIRARSGYLQHNWEFATNTSRSIAKDDQISHKAVLKIRRMFANH
jgi:hypothetical protein